MTLFCYRFSYFCLEFLWQMSFNTDTTFQFNFSSHSSLLRSSYLLLLLTYLLDRGLLHILFFLLKLPHIYGDLDMRPSRWLTATFLMTQHEAGWACPQGTGVVDSPWASHVYLNQFQKGTTKLLPNIWLLKLGSIKEWMSLLFWRKYSARTIAPPVTTTSRGETLVFSAAHYPFPHSQQVHSNLFIWKQYNY